MGLCSWLSTSNTLAQSASKLALWDMILHVTAEISSGVIYTIAT